MLIILYDGEDDVVFPNRTQPVRVTLTRHADKVPEEDMMYIHRNLCDGSQKSRSTICTEKDREAALRQKI